MTENVNDYKSLGNISLNGIETKYICVHLCLEIISLPSQSSAKILETLHGFIRNLFSWCYCCCCPFVFLLTIVTDLFFSQTHVNENFGAHCSFFLYSLHVVCHKLEQQKIDVWDTANQLDCKINSKSVVQHFGAQVNWKKKHITNPFRWWI